MLALNTHRFKNGWTRTLLAAIVCAFIFGSGVLFAESGHRARLIGQWRLLLINDKGRLIEVPGDGSALAVMEFRADGTGEMRMARGEKKTSIPFQWTLDENGRVTMNEPGRTKLDVVTMGFMKNQLILIKSPDDLMLLESVGVPEAPAQPKQP